MCDGAIARGAPASRSRTSSTGRAASARSRRSRRARPTRSPPRLERGRHRVRDRRRRGNARRSGRARRGAAARSSATFASAIASIVAMRRPVVLDPGVGVRMHRARRRDRAREPHERHRGGADRRHEVERRGRAAAVSVHISGGARRWPSRARRWPPRRRRAPRLRAGASRRRSSIRRGERGDRRLGEELGVLDAQVELAVDRVLDLDRLDRVAAELDEVVVDADRRDAERLLPQPRERRLDLALAARGTASRALPRPRPARPTRAAVRGAAAPRPRPPRPSRARRSARRGHDSTRRNTSSPKSTGTPWP